MMKYRVPYYYPGFSCIGAACEDTCCGGWKIPIDRKSLAEYVNTPGRFGKKLKRGIDLSSRCFRLSGRGCMFLDTDGLCEIEKELGKDKLCRACRHYPRHMEDYGNLREFTLSLSCPEAARIILGDEYQGASKEIVKEDVPWEDEGKGGDSPWGDKKWLEQIRHTASCLIKDRQIKWEQRLSMVMAFAHDVQRHWDKIRSGDCPYEKQVGEMEEASVQMTVRYMAQDAATRFANKLKPYEDCGRERMSRISAWMREAEKLEPVLERWEKKQAFVCTALYHRLSTAEYLMKMEAFLETAAEYEQEWENLALYFIYTYMLGAMYDGDLYGKAKFMAFSLMFIQEWCFFCYVRTGRFTNEDLTAVSYRYSREIENSDENLGAVEDLFFVSPLFTLDSILKVICGCLGRH